MINNDRVLKLQCPDGKCKIVRVYKDRIVGSPDETYMDMLRIQDIDNDVETSAELVAVLVTVPKNEDGHLCQRSTPNMTLRHAPRVYIDAGARHTDECRSK